MAENKFGKVSRFSLDTIAKQGKTVLKDVSFTAPYKIMAPFEKQNGGISVMPLCASAGIMEGDCQQFHIHVGENTDLELLSQSFEKIHRMEKGQASRHVQAEVEKNAAFYYNPQPVIPYRGSSFESVIEIHLADGSSRLFMLDILSCGRKAFGEQFAYRKFASKVAIYRGGKLIYRDHTRYEPVKMPMNALGMYEGYTHLANLFLSGPGNDMQEKIWNILEQEQCEGGVTLLAKGDLAVRILGNRGQRLQDVAQTIKNLFAEG